MSNNIDNGARGAKHNSSRRLFLGAVAASGTIITLPAAATPTDPDAELIRLGKLFDHFAGAEKAAWAIVMADDTIDDPHPEFIRASGLADETFAIIDQIEPLPANTLAGLIVKIRALTHLCPCDPVADLVDTHAGWGWKFPIAMTPDVRLLIGIIEDLQTIGGVTQPRQPAELAEATT